MAERSEEEKPLRPGRESAPSTSRDGGPVRTREVDDLLRVFATLKDETTIFALLEDLFTVREIRETSQRLAVARLLADGKSYTVIEAATGASATTIARVSKCLSDGAGGYKAALAVLDDHVDGLGDRCASPRNG